MVIYLQATFYYKKIKICLLTITSIFLLRQVKNSHIKILQIFDPQLGAFLGHYHINTKSYGQ
jgi:hypothetical protein